MAFFSKSNPEPTPKNLTSEIGFAGDIVFEGFDREESRVDEISIKDYRKMLDNDTTVEALYNIFTMSILAATYHIDADSNDEGEVQAELVRRNLLEPPHKGGMQTPMNLFIDQSLAAIYEGFALFEKVYEVRDGRLVLKRLAHRDSTTLTLIRDTDGGFGGTKQRAADSDGVYHEVIIPAHKCFLFTYGKSRSYLYGRSAFKPLYPRYDKKRRLEYLDSIALQANAIKPKVLRRITDGVVTDELKRAHNKALEVLGRLGKRNSVASLPYGYELDVLNTEGRDPHQSIERQNSEMARAFHASVILTATQGSASNVGSYSLSTNQKDLLQTAITGVMRLLEAHINQYLIADLIDLNFAERHYPEFHFDTPDESIISAVFEAFKLLVQKDKVSDDIAAGIEESTATRLGIDLEAIKKRRQEDAEDDKPAGKENENADDDKDGGSGGDAGKFLGEDDNTTNEATTPESEPHKHVVINRALTDAEKRVKFDAIEKWMAEQEASFEAAATEELHKAVADISLNEDFTLPASYSALIAKYYRTAYNYGKLSAADEQKLPAPALKAELKAREKQYIDFIINMQTEDVRNIIAGEKLKRPINLADDDIDEDVVGAISSGNIDENTRHALLESIGLLTSAWITQAVLGTKGTIVTQGMNDGRDDSFSFFDEDDDTAVYQWSARMEKNTCPICAELDGKVISANERRTTFQRPPKHINCKCIWTRISALNKGYKLPAVTGIDNKLVERLEHIQRTTKAELANTIPGALKYTKAELSSIEAYKGNGYININQALLGNHPMNPYAENDIKQLDKAIRRTTLENDVLLYRGVGFKKPLKVGEEIDNPNFLSTSTSRDISMEFAEKADWQKYILVFRAPKSMPYLDIDKTLADNNVNSTINEREYLLSRGKKLVVKNLSKRDNGVIVAEVEMTDDTKYLDDSNDSILTEDLLREIDESYERSKKRIADPNYKPSQTTRRLHHIWQMDSDYFNEHPEAIKSKDNNE
nr:MAG TPA: Portal protein [Caudoviricetes sp.]